MVVISVVGNLRRIRCVGPSSCWCSGHCSCGGLSLGGSLWFGGVACYMVVALTSRSKRFRTASYGANKRSGIQLQRTRFQIVLLYHVLVGVVGCVVVMPAHARRASGVLDTAWKLALG